MTEIRWVIIGVHGLYIGQWQRRKDAIRGHCKDLAMTWERCRERGDRAVKAEITERRPGSKDRRSS